MLRRGAVVHLKRGVLGYDLLCPADWSRASSGVSSGDVGAALALCGHLKARLEEQTQAVLAQATRTKQVWDQTRAANLFNSLQSEPILNVLRSLHHVKVDQYPALF